MRAGAAGRDGGRVSRRALLRRGAAGVLGTASTVALAGCSGLDALAGDDGSTPTPTERPVPIRNSSDAARGLRVTIGRNGVDGLLLDRRLTVAPDERVEERVRVAATDRYVLSASTDQGDGAAEFQRVGPASEAAFLVTVRDGGVTVRILARG